MRQFQCVPTAYVTKSKETYLEIYTFQVSCPLFCVFKHSKLPISIRISVTLPQSVYICMTAVSPNLSS